VFAEVELNKTGVLVNTESLLKVVAGRVTVLSYKAPVHLMAVLTGIEVSVNKAVPANSSVQS